MYLIVFSAEESEIRDVPEAPWKCCQLNGVDMCDVERLGLDT